jgi:hypothetical protein
VCTPQCFPQPIRKPLIRNAFHNWTLADLLPYFIKSPTRLRWYKITQHKDKSNDWGHLFTPLTPLGKKGRYQTPVSTKREWPWLVLFLEQTQSFFPLVVSSKKHLLSFLIISVNHDAFRLQLGGNIHYSVSFPFLYLPTPLTDKQTGTWPVFRWTAPENNFTKRKVHNKKSRMCDKIDSYNHVTHQQKQIFFFVVTAYVNIWFACITIKFTAVMFPTDTLWTHFVRLWYV